MNWLRGIDWTRSDAELARKYKVKPLTVWCHRQRFFRMLRCWWNTAEKYGVSSSHLARMRKKYGVRRERPKKKPRPPRPPGRSSSLGLRAFVLQAIEAGSAQVGEIHDYVLNTWGSVSERTLYGALAHLRFLGEITYTRSTSGARLYVRLAKRA